MTSVPPEQSTCPRITRSGDKLTATGGCTDDNGDTIAGRIVVKNVPGFLGGGNDPTNLHVSMGGVEVWSDATWRRSAADRSSADAGSAIEITNVGRAEIRGSWNMDSENPAGALELHGADVLRANFDAVVNDCVPLTIDGAPAAQLCPTAEESGGGV